MKNAKAALVAVGILMIASASLAGDKPRIAVGDPTTKWASGGACSGVSANNYADSVARSLSTRLVETGAFKVLSRSQIKRIIKEHELVMTGLGDPATAKATGRLLQADFLLVTDVVCHPDHVEFLASLIDVETGEKVWAKTYEMRNLRKTSRALKDIAKLVADYARTGSIGKSAGKTEAMMMIDSKALHDAADAIMSTIERAIPNARATIEEVNPYAGTIRLKVRGRAFPGLVMKVIRDDEEVGQLILKKKKRGMWEAVTRDEISSFEEGDEASSEDVKARVAIGYIEDEEEQDDKMVDLFKKGLVEELSQSDKIEVVDSSKVDRLLMRMGQKVRKSYLEKLFKAGVDLLVTGRFSGERGNRRIDFEVLNTVDGKRVTRIKYDSRL
ncbi:MAG: hypothetical protein D6806_10370 [Deltaproteobacteria bacterium]|nr:MAG: hypothetical protein D6806_10370 [Deltaproteobacteria bacterium]